MLLLPLDCRQELEILLVLNLLVQPLAIGLHLLQVVLGTHVVLGLVVDLLRQDVQVLVLSQALAIACPSLQNLRISLIRIWNIFQTFMNCCAQAICC